MDNPLLKKSAFPQFTEIKAEHVIPAIDQILEDNRKQIAELLENIETPTWENLILPLDELENKLSDAWSPVSHLNAVTQNDELREAYNACLPKLSAYSTELGQNEKLYQAIRKISQSIAFDDYSIAQKKAITNALRDFKLSGISLNEEKKKQYGELQSRLSELHSKFSDNATDATNAWTKQVTELKDLQGIPRSSLAMMEANAKANDKDGYYFDLQFPYLVAVLTYCENRELRKEMAIANGTRASQEGPLAGQFDNTEIISELLETRLKLANLLDFETYADYSLATKMASSTDEVVDFLAELVEQSKSQGEEEFAKLEKFAQDELGLDKLEAWDLGFATEKMKQKLFDINKEELRPYFPEKKVFDGLFTITSRLFGVEVTKEKDFNSYHEDLQLYKVSRNGEAIAYFYTDFYSRQGKNGGAWMDGYRSRYTKADGETQIPIAYLVANFTRATEGKPALLTHDEVHTIFHEFGHGLQHMLTQVDVKAVSGISGVAWDAVELPSQFLENWCWDKEGIELISGHYETGDALPADKLNKLIEAKNFNSAMAMLRQLEFASFDFHLHLNYGSEDYLSVEDTIHKTRHRISVTPSIENNRFQNSFGHIFAGGYAAGYYSYKWAEVLSADAFSRFEEEGIFNEETGRDFANTVLAEGGSREAADVFESFRGRSPSIEALLRHSGISA